MLQQFCYANDEFKKASIIFLLIAEITNKNVLSESSAIAFLLFQTTSSFPGNKRIVSLPPQIFLYMSSSFIIDKD